MKKTIEVEVPEGYEIDINYISGIGGAAPYINIPLKKVEVKNWKWYVEEYFKTSSRNAKLANPLSTISDSYLQTTKENFLCKDFGQIWEYKIGLLKFICNDLKVSFAQVVYHITYHMKDDKSPTVVSTICPKEFLESIL